MTLQKYITKIKQIQVHEVNKTVFNKYLKFSNCMQYFRFHIVTILITTFQNLLCAFGNGSLLSLNLD